MKTAGIIIFVIGLLMTIYTGVTYVTREKIVDVGELEVTVNDRHTINWQPYVGIGAMIIGGLLFVLSRKKLLAI